MYAKRVLLRWEIPLQPLALDLRSELLKGAHLPEKMLERLLEIRLALLCGVSVNASALVFSVCVPSLGPLLEDFFRASGTKNGFVGDFLRCQDGCVDDGAFSIANWSHSAVCVRVNLIIAMCTGTVVVASTDGRIAAKTLRASVGLESWASRERGEMYATT